MVNSCVIINIHSHLDPHPICEISDEKSFLRGLFLDEIVSQQEINMYVILASSPLQSLASRMCSRMLWREMIQPAHDWGPALPQHRKLRQELDAAELEIDKILDHDPNLTVDSIDFRVPYHLYNSCSNSAYSSRSDLTMYESHV